MYFAVYGLDRPGSGELRARLRDAHRQRLRQHDHPVKVLIGGPLLADDGEAMIGSLLVIEAGSKADVEAFLAGDQYQQAGLYERVEVRPFKWGLGAPVAAG